MPPNPPVPFPLSVGGKGALASRRPSAPLSQAWGRVGSPLPQRWEGGWGWGPFALAADRLVVGALVDEELQSPLVAAEQDVRRALRFGRTGGEERHEPVGRRAGRLVDVD